MERRPSPTGMYEQIQVSRNCMPCGGSGTIWVADPMPSAPNPDPRTHGTVTRGDDGQITIVEPKVPKTPEEKDEMFTSIATLLVAGYTGYLAYGGGFQLETWTFWLITLTPASIVLGGLLKYPLLARKLRLITNALIGLGVLYLLIRFLAA